LIVIESSNYFLRLIHQIAIEEEFSQAS